MAKGITGQIGTFEEFRFEKRSKVSERAPNRQVRISIASVTEAK